MDSPEPPVPPEAAAHIEVTVTDEAILFTSGETPGCIYLDPKLNHTPIQCAHLMKLRRSFGDNVMLRDSASVQRATIHFPDDDTATVTIMGTDGAEIWTDTLHAAECLPDAPDFIVPRIRPMYRALTAAVALFFAGAAADHADLCSSPNFRDRRKYCGIAHRYGKCRSAYCDTHMAEAVGPQTGPPAHFVGPFLPQREE